MTSTQLLVIALMAAVAAVVIGRFELVCLRDLSEASDAELQYLTRPAWFVAIVLAIPIGGIAYIACGRAR